MIDNFTIQKLRDLPIEGVAERLGLTVTKHKSLCPFHDDSHLDSSSVARWLQRFRSVLVSSPRCYHVTMLTSVFNNHKNVYRYEYYYNSLS